MFNELFELENIFAAWYEFKKGKSNKLDVMFFETKLEDNIFRLQEDLITKTYFHQPYEIFHIWDPKFRIISKASVRDRVVHHVLYGYLEKYFQPIFIDQSYSCQIGKGVHKAVNDLSDTLRRATRNYRQNIWYLKLDIKKFFASVDHELLLNFLKKRISDPDILGLLEKIVCSYKTLGKPGKGVPIGNLTSQIFANIYMNELDHFVKFDLKEKYYFRYADDFIFLHEDRKYLEKLQNVICQFVEEKLHLTVHPDKIFLQKYSQGIDFLGYVLLPHYQVLRTKTKRRMFKKMSKKIEEFNEGRISEFDFGQSIQSYLGMLQHCEGYGLETKLKSEIWVSKNL